MQQSTQNRTSVARTSVARTSVARLAQMVTDCEDRESKLTDWERGFIDSMRSQIDASRTLSDEQAETLDRIWERVT